MRSNLTPINDTRGTLAEGPCWDERNQLLYWVDIKEKEVHIYDPASSSDRKIGVGQFAGAVVLKKSGGAVAVLHKGFYSIDLETEKVTHIATPKSHPETNRFNDGKCDAAGRFWAGTCELSEKEPLGELYCLEPDHTVRTVLTGVYISNGISWSPDNTTMYYIDSPTRVVMAYDYDLASGTISNGRVAVRIPEGGGFPDGMTTDVEGMIWVAQWGGWQVSRWNPNTGEMIDAVPIPVERVSSCIFGGPNMDELYITTAKPDPADPKADEQPYAGGIFRVKAGIKGLPSYRFGG